MSNVTETCIERLRNRISFNPDIPRKIRTVLVGARGFMDETKQFDAEGLRQYVHKDKKFWPKLKAHIENYENKQDCIDFYNNL